MIKMSDNKLVDFDHVKAKLLKLIGQVQDATDVVETNSVDNEVLADHLLDNGVTILGADTFSFGYSRGYTRAIQDLIETFFEINHMLTLYRKRWNYDFIKQTLELCLKHRAKMRDRRDGGVRAVAYKIESNGRIKEQIKIQWCDFNLLI